MSESAPQSSLIATWMLLLFAVILALNLTAGVIPLWTRVILGVLGLVLTVEGFRRRHA